MTEPRHDPYDVICVGGAVVGSAVAYFLTEHPGFDGRVLVVEPDPSYATASSARSAASIREQFSNPRNICMSQFGMEFVAGFHDRVQVDGDAPDPGFRGTGYLILATASGMPVLEANHRTQLAAGAQVRLLTPAELAAEFPFLNADGLAGGSLGGAREGSLDAWAMLQGLRRRASANGADYLRDRVAGIDVRNGRVTGVRLASGGRVACGHVVNAAGTRAAEIAAMVGLALPVEPRARTVFQLACRSPIDQTLPLTVTPEGVWVRRERDHYLAGAVPHDDRAVAHDDFTPRRDEFEELVWPALARHVRQFERLSVVSCWAGHYAFNTIDQNMVIGPAPAVDNFIFANGFSGHGLQHSPAVGRAVSELIVDGGYRTLDLGELGYERVIRGEPVLESVII